MSETSLDKLVSRLEGPGWGWNDLDDILPVTLAYNYELSKKLKIVVDKLREYFPNRTITRNYLYISISGTNLSFNINNSYRGSPENYLKI